MGVATYTKDLLFALGHSAMRERVILLCPSWLNEHPVVKSCGLEVEVLESRIFSTKKVRSILWSEMAGLRLSREPAARFHSPGLHSSILLPKKTFITCHDVIPLRYPVYFGRNFFRRWSFKRHLRTLKKCEGIFTDSKASKLDLINLAGVSSEKIYELPCWLAPEFSLTNASRLKDQIRVKYDLPESYWLYVGGYDIRKNVPFLLAAYSEAIRSGIPCLPLVLAGRIPKRKIPALCDMELALEKMGASRKNIITPGFIEQEDLPGLYGGAELFIYPSLFEGFGLPPLEAMGCGCPAIVADNSSLREVVKEPEYRFSTDSPESLIAWLQTASFKRISLNPLFSTADFSLKQSLQHYLKIMGMVENFS